MAGQGTPAVSCVFMAFCDAAPFLPLGGRRQSQKKVRQWSAKIGPIDGAALWGAKPDCTIDLQPQAACVRAPVAARLASTLQSTMPLAWVRYDATSGRSSFAHNCSLLSTQPMQRAMFCKPKTWRSSPYMLATQSDKTTTS